MKMKKIISTLKNNFFYKKVINNDINSNIKDSTEKTKNADDYILSWVDFNSDVLKRLKNMHLYSMENINVTIIKKEYLDIKNKNRLLFVNNFIKSHREKTPIIVYRNRITKKIDAIAPCICKYGRGYGEMIFLSEWIYFTNNCKF